MEQWESFRICSMGMCLSSVWGCRDFNLGFSPWIPNCPSLSSPLSQAQQSLCGFRSSSLPKCLCLSLSPLPIPGTLPKAAVSALHSHLLPKRQFQNFPAPLQCWPWILGQDWSLLARNLCCDSRAPSLPSAIHKSCYFKGFIPIFVLLFPFFPLLLSFFFLIKRIKKKLRTAVCCVCLQNPHRRVFSGHLGISLGKYWKNHGMLHIHCKYIEFWYFLLNGFL